MGEAMPALIISRQQGARAVVGAVAGALAVAVAAPGAAANVPATVRKVEPVRIPWASNSLDGALTTTLTYTDTTASATASSGITIGLGAGFSFRLRTCVAYHLDNAAPVSRCAERSVDTHANSASVHPTAPSVTLSGQPRPTTEPW